MVPDVVITDVLWPYVGGEWIICGVQRHVYDNEAVGEERVPELYREMSGLLIDNGCAVGSIKFENQRDVKERRNTIFGYGEIPTTDAPPTLERSE